MMDKADTHYFQMNHFRNLYRNWLRKYISRIDMADGCLAEGSMFSLVFSEAVKCFSGTL